MADEQGAVELALEGKATVVDGTVYTFRPKCTYVAPSSNSRCLLPAAYEFELNPKYWPGAKPPIIQYSCTDHADQVRTLFGVIRIDTL
jgi:hypothetical protein